MKYMSNILMVLLLNIIMSCVSSNKDSIILSVKNPTSHVYNFNVDSIKNIIKQNFSNYQYYKLSLADKSRPLTFNIFRDSSNKNDFVLEEFINFHNCTSKVYIKKNGTPYIYCAIYHIHLQNISKNQTRVSVFVKDPNVLKGLSRLPTLPHFSKEWVYLPVKSTTVEEYEILLIIGNALGGKDMPPLKIPNKIII